MFHRSERLFLRPAWPEDWNDILAAIADEAIVRHLAAAPWPYRESHARAFVAKAQDPLYPNFLVTLPEAGSSKLVGMCGLVGQEEGAGVQLGYWIARPYWGNGFATEAARAVIEMARIIGHRHIAAVHHVDNPASGKVLRKAGFLPTGRVAPTYCLARHDDVDSVFYEYDLAADSVPSMRAA